MRISNNNINEEEREYWDKYGKLIFEYSCLKHKSMFKSSNTQDIQRFQDINNMIPADIIEDYLNTRERNFLVNKAYLNWVEDGFIDFLAYGKDDTATLGLNIKEAESINREIIEKSIEKKAVLHTGSDEVILLLLARALLESFQLKVSIFPVYSLPNGEEIIPRYEDQPLFQSFRNHLKITGAQQAESAEEADMIALLHTPELQQDDFALQEFFEHKNKKAAVFCVETIKKSDKPLIIADVCCANGADTLLVEKLLLYEKFLEKIYGYAGWNTASNTIGTTLSMGISRYIAEKEKSFFKECFNKLVFLRFADDWAYQSIARQKIRAVSDQPDEVALCRELMPLIERIAPKFNINSDMVMVSFPWGRTFEVEINILQ